MSQRLQGRTAWITGIGAATARRLRAAGANVMVTGHRLTRHLRARPVERGLPP